jgi:hypothetical protein
VTDKKSFLDWYFCPISPLIDGVISNSEYNKWYGSISSGEYALCLAITGVYQLALLASIVGVLICLS